MIEKNLVGQRNLVGGKNLLWIHRPYLPGMWEGIKTLCPSPKVVVELGSNIGRWSKEVLARFPSVTEFHAVDLWPNDEELEGWRENVTDPKAIPHRCSTSKASRKINVVIDLLYVDADHSFVRAKEDLTLWVPKVRSGGLVLIDDYSIPGVRRAIKEFLRGRSVKSGIETWGGDIKDVNTQFWFLKW